MYTLSQEFEAADELDNAEKLQSRELQNARSDSSHLSDVESERQKPAEMYTLSREFDAEKQPFRVTQKSEGGSSSQITKFESVERKSVIEEKKSIGMARNIIAAISDSPSPLPKIITSINSASYDEASPVGKLIAEESKNILRLAIKTNPDRVVSGLTSPVSISIFNRKNRSPSTATNPPVLSPSLKANQVWPTAYGFEEPVSVISAGPPPLPTLPKPNKPTQALKMVGPKPSANDKAVSVIPSSSATVSSTSKGKSTSKKTALEELKEVKRPPNFKLLLIADK